MKKFFLKLRRILKILFYVILLVVLVVFAISNNQQVTLSIPFLNIIFEAKFYTLIFVFVLLGMVIIYPYMQFKKISSNRRIRFLESKISAMQTEINGLHIERDFYSSDDVELKGSIKKAALQGPLKADINS